MCYSEEEKCSVPQPCEWGWGSPTATDKDLDKEESPGVRPGHLEQLYFGPAWSSTLSKVTMGCNMCVVQKPEEQYRVMFQVSTQSTLPRSLFFCSELFSFLSLSPQATASLCVFSSNYSLLFSLNLALSYSDAAWWVKFKTVLMIIHTPLPAAGINKTSSHWHTHLTQIIHILNS